jgi:hypothetical protein
MENAIQFRFGKYNIDLICKEYKSIDFLRLHFENYLTNTHPDATIKITVIPSDRTAILKSINRYTYLIDNERFNFGPNLIQGYWDAQNRICDIKICDFILTQEEVWLFDRVLCRMFYTLSLETENDKLKNIIIHCAGVGKNGNGYIFFGGPGSGKSTIASFSRKFNVLHDDMNLVSINEQDATVVGVPFNPKLIDRTNRSGKLAMICSLHQADFDRIEKGTREEFIQKILPEVFLPLPLLSEDKKQAFNYLLSCVRQLADMVPYCRLYFRKDDKFWEIINREEDGNG